MATTKKRSRVRTPKAEPEGGFKKLFKIAFAFGLGSLAALMVLIALAVGLFIGGFVLVKKEMKKPKEQQSTTRKVIGFVLMGLAMIIGLGFGAPIFFSLLGDAI